MARPQTITDKMVTDRLLNNNKNFEFVGRFYNEKSKSILGRFVCNNCGYIFDRVICEKNLKTMKCKNCQKERLERRVTKDDFVKKINSKGIDLVSEFISLQERATFKCKVCSNIWEAKCSSVYNTTGCPKCAIKRVAKSKIKSDKQFKAEMKNCAPTLDVVGLYLNEETVLEFYCNKHGISFSKKAKDALGSIGCEMCLHEFRTSFCKKSEDIFDEELYNFNKDIIRIGNYINSRIKTQFKCLLCNSIFERTPDDALNIKNCPICTNKYSGEVEIEKFLLYNNISYIFQKRYNKCRDKKPLPFDFYFKDINVLCEFQGEYHYFPVDFKGSGKKWAENKFKYTERHDAIKSKFCEENNIRLLEIPYWEKENINEILMSFFKQYGIKSNIPE